MQYVGQVFFLSVLPRLPYRKSAIGALSTSLCISFWSNSTFSTGSFDSQFDVCTFTVGNPLFVCIAVATKTISNKLICQRFFSWNYIRDLSVNAEMPRHFPLGWRGAEPYWSFDQLLLLKKIYGKH